MKKIYKKIGKRNCRKIGEIIWIFISKITILNRYYKILDRK